MYMNNHIVNKELIRQRFARSVDSYQQEATIQSLITQKMTERLTHYLPNHLASVLEFGCGRGGFTRAFLNKFQPEMFWINDLCPEMEEALSDILKKYPKFQFIPGDIEHTTLPQNLDAIVSCSALQWFESPIDFIHKCAQQVVSGGILAFSTFGPKNLLEIAEITGVSLPYISLEDWKKALAEDYQILEATEDIRQLYFQSPLNVLQHLKKTGVNGICAMRWNKTKLEHFVTQYTKCFGTINSEHIQKVPLTYHPIYIIIQKRK